MYNETRGLVNSTVRNTNMKKHLLIPILLFSQLTFATQQIPDEFVIDGAKFEIETYPLEQNPDYEKIIKKLNLTSRCSANWRGYKGKWNIRNNFLVLEWLIKDACSKKPEHLSAVDLIGIKKGPLKATWFTGNINIRISARKYFSIKTDGFSGLEYQAVVYNFTAGKLVSRSIETITERW